jgi:osmotically-inducible protein OsmY
MRGRSLALTFMGGVGLGALAMYFLDPTTGNRRRTEVRDKAFRAGRRTGHAIEGRAKALADQAKQVAARARRRFESENPPDEVLSQRVRTALSRIIAHPRQISIAASGGTVTLSGAVGEEESNALSAAVRRVRGVKEVVDQTEVRSEVAG